MRKIVRIKPEAALPKRKKVAAYARVSMESERLAHSLAAQISYYSELIQRNPEWEYAGVYADNFISGTSTHNRSEFQRMIADCEQGKISMILCKSISRFARNTVDLLNTVRHLKELNVEVWFEKETLSTFSSDGELILTLLASFAEEESRSISENLKWSIRKKFEKGEIWHTPAFGYRWNGKTFIVDEHEAAAVRRIFQDYLDDFPLRHIAKWLKAEGYISHTVQFVAFALKNEVYTGNKLLQKYYSDRVRRCRKNNGELPMYYVAESHEPIISQEIFNRVQQKIQDSYAFNPEAHRMVKPSCFSAKIVCRYCGANYVKGLVKTNAFDGLRESWCCYRKIKKCCPESKRINGDRLKKAACTALGITEFDENLFASSVHRITPNDDSLTFLFYSGEKAEVPFHYFNNDEKKYTDPHSRLFAYSWSSDGYQIIEKEAEAIKLMYEYYADGMTISDIARKLFAQGYTTSRGKMSRKTIANALDSDLYIGKRLLKAQFTESGKDEFLPHPRIIDDELNERVKERRKNENRHKNSGINQPIYSSTD